eukprot:3838127-Amphidinium_carterae.1
MDSCMPGRSHLCKGAAIVLCCAGAAAGLSIWVLLRLAAYALLWVNSATWKRERIPGNIGILGPYHIDQFLGSRAGDSICL